MKILIADDHELFLKGLEIILTDFNPASTLVKAKDYVELLDIVKKESEIIKWQLKKEVLEQDLII